MVSKAVMNKRKAQKRTLGITSNKTATVWRKREAVAKRYMRAAFTQMGQKGELTSAHNLGHVQRVSLYAGEYVKTMGGGLKKQARARIGGLAHDRFRDAADSMKQKEQNIETHETKGARYMQPLFEKRYGSKSARVIAEAMGKHGSLPALSEVGKNLERDGIAFADKFFEANGAYIGFRRSMFMGERADWKAEAIKRDVAHNPAALRYLAVEAILKESEKRVAAFSDLSKIPTHMHKFVKYQVEWQHKLVAGLQAGDKGIVNLTTVLFAEGLKEKPRDLGELIKTYKPVAQSDAAFKQEAMDYLNGKLAVKFKQLLG